MIRRALTLHALLSARRESGEVPSTKEMRHAAISLRKIAEATTGLPDDSPTDARMRDRLELAADVLDAGAGADPEEPV